MAEVLSGNNVEEEFVWSIRLDKDNKSYEWFPGANSEGEENAAEITRNGDDSYDEELKPGHRLMIKNAFLGPDTKDGEINIVQLECLGYGKKEVTCPILAMKGGVDLQRNIDQSLPGKAKLTLISGNGPIHLVGSHVLDMYNYRDLGLGNDEESEAEEDEEEEEMEQDGEAKENKTKSEDKKDTKNEKSNNKRKSLEQVNGDGDNIKDAKKVKTDSEMKSPKVAKSPKNAKSPKASTVKA